jgi:adenosine deaminase
MPTLLVTLGKTWPVVPEAFHLLRPGPDWFSEVHVLTSSHCEIDKAITEVTRYFRSFPQATLTFTRVAGFDDLRSENDHAEFDEVMCRWILEKAPDPETRYICLAGGFKTMSAAMQRAASFLGAAEVFHVLAAPEINTPESIARALEEDRVHFIRLGSQAGWPQLRLVDCESYPLDSTGGADNIRCVRAPDHSLTERLRTVQIRSQRIAASWEQMANLPFAELATWSEADLAWLQEPVDPRSEIDRAWIARLPKVELHCHLGGFATHGDELRAIRAAAEIPACLPPLKNCQPPPAWPHALLPGSPGERLQAYMRLGDNNGRQLLRDRGCLREQCRQLYRHLIEQRVAYAEIRCSPNNYASADRSAMDVLADIRDCFQREMARASASRDPDPAAGSPCHVNVIIIATRRDGGDRSDISRHIALAITAADQWREPGTCRVVGVDLAGFEHRETRAALFQADFDAVHRVGLAVTVHAGENDDAEGIWQAVFKLNARRLGHALHLGQSPDLLRAVVDRGIGIEMCPYANVQIKGFAPFASGAPEYPLLNYLRAGARVTVNTDNPGISAAALTDNLLLCARLCPALTRLDLLRLQRHAISAAFLGAGERRSLLARFAIFPPGRETMRPATPTRA